LFFVYLRIILPDVCFKNISSNFDLTNGHIFDFFYVVLQTFDIVTTIPMFGIVVTNTISIFDIL